MALNQLYSADKYQIHSAMLKTGLSLSFSIGSQLTEARLPSPAEKYYILLQMANVIVMVISHGV